MSALPPGPVSPRAVPTLTEVLQRAPTVAGDGAPPALDEARIIEQVLARFQHQIDPQLAAQVQAAMAPALAQAIERLLHETRQSMARHLREQVALLVADAVASALAETPPERRTGRSG